jgi:transglutaminase-like putative cysteine protease
VYRYRDPVGRSEHIFRLRPVDDLHQRVLEHTVELSVDGHRREFEDVFGNRSLLLQVGGPFWEMTIRSRSRVRVTRGTSIEPDGLTRRPHLPLRWMPWQHQMMLPYLLPHELPMSELETLSDYARGFAERNDQDLLRTIVDMNRTIHAEYGYEPGTTDLETTPYELFRSRRGVCQDFANLLICLLRLHNVPARYRVGYIHTGADYAEKRQSEASHAWVEAYLPWYGWRGLDPTNGVLSGLDHVRVACGRNYRDATPTSGILYEGGAGESMEVAVRVDSEEVREG